MGDFRVHICVMFLDLVLSVPSSPSSRWARRSAKPIQPLLRKLFRSCLFMFFLNVDTVTFYFIQLYDLFNFFPDRLEETEEGGFFSVITLRSLL